MRHTREMQALGFTRREWFSLTRWIEKDYQSHRKALRNEASREHKRDPWNHGEATP